MTQGVGGVNKAKDRWGIRIGDSGGSASGKTIRDLKSTFKAEEESSGTSIRDNKRKPKSKKQRRLFRGM